MKITRDDACRILGVKEESSPDEVRSSYKRLALKWHPDKHGDSPSKEEATHKFQEVSAAYKRLTTNASDTDDEIDDTEFMNIPEMMELFAHIFFHNGVRGCPHHMNCCDYEVEDDYFYSDEEYYGYTDEESETEFLDTIAHRLRHKYEARKYMGTKDTIPTQWRVTEEEALRNARELIEEEELEKRREEKKKNKRKKKKDKKKQKDKDKKEQEVIIEKLKSEFTIEETDNKDALDPPLEEKKPSKPPNPQPDKKNKNNKSNNNSSKLQPNNQDSSKSKKDNNNSTDKKNKNNKKSEVEGDEDAIDENSAFFLRAASRAPNIHQPPVSTSTNNTHKQPENSNANTTKKKKNNTNNNSEKSNTIQHKKSKNKQLSPSSNTPSSSPPLSKRSEQSNKIKNTQNGEHSTSNKSTARSSSPEKTVEHEQIVYQSRQVAGKGNQMAQVGDYKGAVSMFTKAIQIDPNDYRFFGNRSYCYDRIEQYENALKDGDSAICLAPEWPKGYFRKGRALTGLKRFQEAEQVFQQVLKLDPVCEDAQFELARVRVQILIDMGFTQALSQQAVNTYGTVQQALEALLAGKVSDEEELEDVYLSDDDEEEVTIPPAEVEAPFSSVTHHKPKQHSSRPPQQPEVRCTALWVGNVDPALVTEKQMNQVFSKCGKVASVRILSHKYCAFVNYQDAQGAVNAMNKLQGVGMGNQKLLLRFPNNPPPGSFIPEGGQVKPSSVSESSTCSSSERMNGPVNGGECYFWRTTGCVFEKACRYKHVRGHKGLDLPKVQAKYGKMTPA